MDIQHGLRPTSPDRREYHDKNPALLPLEATV